MPWKPLKLASMEVKHTQGLSIRSGGGVYFDGELSVILTKIDGSEVLPRVKLFFLPQFLNKHVTGSIDRIRFSFIKFDKRFFKMIQATEPERLKARTMGFYCVDARGLSTDNLKQLLSSSVKEFVFIDLLISITHSEFFKLPAIRQAFQVKYSTIEYASLYTPKTISTEELLDFMKDGPEGKMMVLPENFLKDGHSDLLKKFVKDLMNAKSKGMFKFKLLTISCNCPKPDWPVHEEYSNHLGETMHFFRDPARSDDKTLSIGRVQR